MKRLLDIKEYVQNIAEAIESVVGVDVTIADIESIRIAATGKYKDKIGLKVVDKSVFNKSMINRASYIVNNPRLEDVCEECGNRKACIEFAEVCIPIIIGNESIGVIGLVALSEEQRDNLIRNENNLLEFLKKMGDLLASKIIESESISKERIILKQVETIINSIDDGIMAIDEYKNIIYANKKTDHIFGENNKSILIETLFKNTEIGDVLSSGVEIRNRQLVVGKMTVIFNAKPIELDESIIGCVISIRSMKDINKIINDVSNSSIYTGFRDIIGVSTEIESVKDMGLKASKGDSTVLIMGESGTGKEMFARAIHNHSARKDRPFIAINCAAIPESLLESELFGYEEGSFTGAKRGGKIGKFELANGGTIFLDEIGDMPLHLQIKLLRALQERVIERVGSLNSTSIDIRVVAATHKDLFNMVRHGEFRSDLFYRLNVIPLKIPALRERRDDISILMKHFLAKCNKKLGKEIKDFEEDVYQNLLTYNWPGNVRELENVIEYAVNMETCEIISYGSLPPRFRENLGKDAVYNLKNLEEKTIEEVLKKYKNKDLAAMMLGIGRATLFRKIKEYNIKTLD